MNRKLEQGKKDIVLVDIDDTLAKTTPAYLRDIAAHAVKLFRAASHPSNWRRGPRYMFEASLQDAGFYRNLPVQEDSLAVLEDLKDDYDFKIATSRKLYLRSDTEFWLEQKFPDIFSEMFFDVKDKGELAAEIGAAKIIDNNITHYRSSKNRGVDAIWFAPRWWNGLSKNKRRHAVGWQAVRESFEK
ncbi:MAG: hypothetical protein LBK50_01290 [Candidatus Nomurabacteria bacterium]|jgi:5'(3')-deoxyribonucleotidase|nr:hypothetical protein [Candidatus Nomurabacteria bacterium]